MVGHQFSSPWRPLLALLSWCPIFISSHWNLFEDRASTDFIYECPITWWRHQIETFSALLVICTGISSVTGEFPAQRQVTRSFDIYFDMACIKGWVNNRKAGDLRRHRSNYDVTVMDTHIYVCVCCTDLITWQGTRLVKNDRKADHRVDVVSFCLSCSCEL